MNRNIYDVLEERGIIAQATHPEKIREILGNKEVTFYIGFDPTADSLHLGHFVQTMVMAHLQRAGHKPIAIIGGGTAMVGDPSGRTDLRQMLTEEQIQKNVDSIVAQMSKLIDFSNDNASVVNNKDWLSDLKYIEFLRDIGVHFSVNRMLTSECFKTRLEKGLSFIEFNYMLMQSYDFYKLYKDYNCTLEIGGDDQWSNIIAGVELIRRKLGKEAYGLTFNLLTTSEGKKMGKTAKGALWLNPNKTSPYEFFQYLRNIQDEDVVTCFKMLTFVDMNEIRKIEKLEGAKINEAKERLAYEVTKIVHGKNEAEKALKTSQALFKKGSSIDKDMPTIELSKDQLPCNLLELLNDENIIKSKAEGKRLIKQKGLSLNDDKVDNFNYNLVNKDFKDSNAVVRKGKKKYYRINLV